MTKPMTLVTGKCAAGWHEGNRAKTFRGEPAPTCVRWLTCPCECHARVTKMFEIAEQPRVLMENPDYVHPEPQFYMPKFGIDYGVQEYFDTESISNPDANKEEGAPIAPRRAPAFAPTASGFLAKGELEAYVLEVVTEWLIDHDQLCTCAFVSQEVGRVQKINNPSVGAVNAVFDRWVKIGYAQPLERKPIRFVGLTDEGKSLGLAALKNRAKGRR